MTFGRTHGTSAFLLLLYTETDTLKWRFPQEIATLHENQDGYT